MVGPSCEASVVARLQARGVLSVLDIDEEDDADDFVAVWETEGVSASDLKKLRSEIQEKRSAMVDEAVRDHESGRLGCSVPKPPVRQELVPIAKKKQRTFDRSRGLGLARVDALALPAKRARVLPTSEDTLQSVPITGESHEKAEELAPGLWDIFLELGDQGGLWKEYAELPADLQGSKEEMTLEEFADLPVSSLRGYIGSFRRWQVWAAEHGVDWKGPTATHVAIFLHHLKGAGDTVPHSVLGHLKWLETNVGIHFSSDDKQVGRKGKKALNHIEEPAKPTSWKVWKYLEYISQHANEFIRIMAVFWLLVLQGAMRFAHCQRSRIMVIHQWHFEFEATRGKPKHKGLRRPFRWVAPRYTPGGVDLAPQVRSLMERYRELEEQGRPIFFLLPDFYPRTSDISLVTDIRDTAMGMSKAVDMLRSLLMGHPLYLSEEKAAEFTGHSPRHTLPSLADRASYETQERLAIGKWARDAEDTSTMRKESRRLAMAVRYSNQTLLTEARCKAELVISANLAEMDYINSGAASAGSYSNDWEDIMLCWPEREVSRKALEVFTKDLASASSSKFAEIQDAMHQSEEEEAEVTPGDEGEDSSTSDSDSSCDPDVSAFEWLRSTGPRGRLHLKKLSGVDPGDTEFTTCCGRRLRNPASGTGIGAALCEDATWSPRCYAKLPDELRCEWLEAHKT